MSGRFSSISLSKKLVAMVIVCTTIVGATVLLLALGDYKQSAQQALVDRALAFTAVADATKNHVSRLQAEQSFDREGLAAELQRDLAAGRPYTETRIFETIPVVAGWMAAAEAAKVEGITFKVAAFDARNHDNDPSADREAGAFRTQLLRDLTSQVDDGNKHALARIDEASGNLHVMRPILLDQTCMTCHGDPRTSPTGDGKDLLGFPMENWKVGDMHGAFEVIFPLAPMQAQVMATSTKAMAATLGLIVAAVIIFSIALRRLMGVPVQQMIERIREIATGDGDLTRRIEIQRDDEIGQLAKWFNTFVDGLHGIISDVRGNTEKVAAAATEVAASAEEMSSSIECQAGQINQVSAAIEEMSCSVGEVARKCAEAADESLAAGSQAAEGGQIVQKTVGEMQGIAEQVNASAGAVETLGRKSQEIGHIIQVINDIADQTNLLALNAAIEAARAGEHGRGFAVVADEVRKLAERTQEATKQVSSTIGEIQSETESAVDQMQRSQTRVRSGVQLATDAGSRLERIVSSAQHVASGIAEIASAAEEQSSTAGQISHSIERINSVTKQASEGAGQAAEAATELSRSAEDLQAIVRRFRL